MKRLLWVGDAVVPTGFARVTENILDHLNETWEVFVMGINYMGDPHDKPYRIYPACRVVDPDMWGTTRFSSIVKKLNPDVICILQDPWNVYRYLKKVEEEDIETPICAYMPIDALNMRSEWGQMLNALTTAIFYTKFGEEVARAAGFSGNSVVIPHGVDLDKYQVLDKQYAREHLGIGKLSDKFIVGNINQNQVRKRLDLTIRYFYKWVKQYDIKDAYLYIHAKSRGVVDLEQLAFYYEQALDIKPRGRFIMLSEAILRSGGIAEEHMKYVYSSLDMQMSTTGGEGWGLTQMEGMACGTPQIVPEFGSLAEWTKGAAAYVHCPMTETWEYNTIGMIPGEAEFVETLQNLYSDDKRRAFLVRCGLNLVSRPFFRWENIAKRFDTVLTSASEESAAENRPLQKEE